MGGFFDDIVQNIQALRNLPKTQEDIRVLAQTAQRFQTPEAQAQLERAQRQLEEFAKFQIGLGIAGVAILGAILLVTLFKK